MPLEALIEARIAATQSVNSPFGHTRSPLEIAVPLTLASGTEASQADIAYFAERPVADGADDDIDLVGGLTDTFGNTIAMAKLVALILVNAPKSGGANTTNLTIGGGANAFTGFLGGTTPTVGPIVPGGMMMLAAGGATGLGAVTADTGDILRVSNAAGAENTYQIGLIGRSA